MIIPLDPFQREGADWLAHAEFRKGALLADEPGLGKTRQAIAAAVERLNRDYLSVGVICPASAIPTWERETKALAPQVFWRIFSYEKAAKLEYLLYHILIVDECHYLKTRNSARTMRVFGPKCDGVGGLAEAAEFVILLSGTPTPNNPSELWTLARACFPEAITHPTRKTPMSWWEFVNRYCNVKEDYLGHFKIMPGGKRIDELRARIAPFVRRRLKRDVYKDLAEPRHSVLPVAGSSVGLEDLDADVADMLDRDGVEGLAKFAPHVATLRRLTGKAKVAGAVAWIEDWFRSGGGKLVVFAYHHDVIVALSEAMRQRGLPCVAGGANGGDILFQSDAGPAIFLGQIQRDGVAITLTAAQTCLLVEQSWVPAENDQAWQRIHRRGQTGLCDIRWVSLAGSIDERIAEALAAKARTISRLWDAAAISVA